MPRQIHYPDFIRRLAPSKKAWVKHAAVWSVVLIASGFLLRHLAAPAPKPIADMPIAVWAWRSSAPSDESVKATVAATGARVLFLRAGQFHLDQSTVSRIRPVVGTLPRGIPLHLVYNATPGLLDGLERVTSETFGAVVGATVVSDCSRAARDGAFVAGIQLDLDMPTRLLPRYTAMLRAVRMNLPRGLQLSITGLPTWMNSPALKATLAETDFWIPQFYGAKIPDRIESGIPISSPASTARDVLRAREIRHPFFAGLAAYGYAIHYDRNGKIRSLRGDLSPKEIARHPNLTFIENVPVSPASFERRVVFRVREDCVFGGLGLKTGESLVLDLPTSENLRACIRAVRENGGDALRGICVFRLPDETDPTVLTASEMRSALFDRPVSPRLDILGRTRSDAAGKTSIEIIVRNGGTGGTLLSPNGLTVEIGIPEGSLHGIHSSDFDRIEFLASSPGVPLAPCGIGRANVIRASAHLCAPGDRLALSLGAATSLQTLPVTLTTRSGNGDTTVIHTTIQLIGEAAS